MTIINSSLALAVAAMFASSAYAQSTCPAPSEARAEIEHTAHAFFDALRKEDRPALQRLTTTSFYAFDAGRRFAGTELIDVVRDAHAKGVELNWTIGPLDTKLSCDVAWTAWENVGSVGVPPDVRPVRWLESAVLVHQDGRWKIDFFHSQRAAEQ